MFKQILVPLDGSPRAEQALPIAARLARASGGSITLLRVVNTSTEFMPSVPAKPALFQTVGETDRVLAESYLKGLADSKRLSGISVEIVVTFGLPAAAILSTAASQHADVIVLCSQSLTGVTHWVLGAVAEKVAGYVRYPC